MNRRRFEEDLELVIASSARSRRPGAVLWLDVDGFKYINDGLGHRAGDVVLMAVAGVLRRLVRAGTSVARIGGDEFAAVLPEADDASASIAGDRLLEGIADLEIAVEGHIVRVTASMGIARFPDHGETAEDVLAKADIAMYYAKARGGGQLHVHEPDEIWHQDVSTQVEWSERIASAIDDGRLLVYAQPLIDLGTDTIVRYELLARLVDDGEILAPSAFIPRAERLGIVRLIDRYMLSRAVATLASESDLRVDVNLSGKAFADRELIDFIEKLLTDSGVDPSRLGLEVTETAAIADVEHAREFMLRLRAFGCRFSLDDFGSGFSSFYHLKHLPADALKIDGAFVRGIADCEEDQHLVRAMIAVARAMSMEAVVEFVEDADSLAVVRRLGADVAQGYHFAMPRPLDEILAERREAHDAT
jgi:diguanylate cyclase (GGDEF)-like protein